MAIEIDKLIARVAPAKKYNHALLIKKKRPLPSEPLGLERW